MNRPRSVPPTNSWDLTNHQRDPIIEEIHVWRETYAARFNYDLDRIFADLKAEETKNSAKRSTAKPVKPKK